MLFAKIWERTDNNLLRVIVLRYCLFMPDVNYIRSMFDWLIVVRIPDTISQNGFV